jgi:hypothetical protein
MIQAEKIEFAGNSRLPEALGPVSRGRHRLPHRLLRVSRTETDPVMIILAAQIQLRRLRRSEPGQSPSEIRRRIREIAAARDTLLMTKTRFEAGKRPSRTV